MGCLLSCCSGTEEDDNGEYGPNTPLLSDCNTQIPTGNSDDYNYTNNMAHSLPRQNDETSKLSKILTDFAEEIIDISVVDHLDTLEQQEVNEKTALYTQKLNANGGRIVRDNSTEIPVLDNLTMRQINDQIQNSNISDSDRTLICRVSKQMESMMGSMRVEQSEDTREMVVTLTGDNLGGAGGE